MSRLPFELFLALRYLRPKRTFVSAITLISVIGVMLGVAVLIIVISVMTGFDHQLREKLLRFSSHISIHRYDEAIGDYDSLQQIIRSNRHVRAVAPQIFGPVVVKTQPLTGKPRFFTPYLRGIDIDLERQISSFTTNIVLGELDLENESLAVGSELAANLELSIGDRVAIYSPRHLEEMERHKDSKEEVAILPDDYTVKGVFDVGYYDYNANVILTSLRNAQDLYQLQGKVHALMVMLDDAHLADEVRSELREALGPEYRMKIWTEDNSQILTAIAVEKNMMFYLLFFIVIVAAFGIMNSQITFVVQKTREIGVMKALGATRAQIMWLFLGQSLFVGTVGVSAGLGLGMLLLEVRNDFLRFMNRMTGLELFPAKIYAFTELPALIDKGEIAIICGAAIVICGLAGLIPAWNAGRLKPVEALRHE